MPRVKKTLIALGLLSLGCCFTCFLFRPKDDSADWVWERVSIDGGADVYPDEIHALTDDDIWAVSMPNVFHFDGREWSLVSREGPEYLWPVARDDVWGVARGLSWFHYDGQQWSHGRVQEASLKYRDFYGVVAWPGEMWGTLGIDGYIRFDGKDWSVVHVPELAGWELQRCFTTNGHVYAAALKGEGEAGKKKFIAAIAHFDGTKWELIHRPPGMQIRGSSPNDLWLVLKVPVHFDGKTWAETPLPDPDALIYDLYARSPTEAYAVGKNSVAFKWDGVKWAPLYAGNRVDLFGVSGGATGPVWAVGARRGELLRYQPDAGK